MDYCITELKRHHLRLTPLRKGLLEYFHAVRVPLSAPEISARFIASKKSIHKTTVYRDLELLVQIGLLHRVRISDGKQYYELSERDHHHHLICKQCEHIYDFELSEHALMKKVEAMAQEIRFTLEEHAIEFYGVCEGCQQ